MNLKRPILRLDIVSRTMYDRKDLIRVVKTSNNQILIDKTNSVNGRGCYIKFDSASILLAKKRNLIARALHINVEEKVYDNLLQLLEN